MKRQVIILVLCIVLVLVETVFQSTVEERYAGGRKLIEPANQFEGSWVGEQYPHIHLHFDAVDGGELKIQNKTVSFKYDRSTYGEYMRLAKVKESTNINILANDTVFSLNARDSGYLTIPKFVETSEGWVDVRMKRE